MQVAEQLDSAAIERLRKQTGFLLGIYNAEIAKDPTSRATESSRSNVIAMQHTVRQMYGEAVARDVSNFDPQWPGFPRESARRYRRRFLSQR